MKKRKLFAIMSVLSLSLGMTLPVFAEDYSDEDAWYDRCSKAQTSQDGVTACQGFQSYQQQKAKELQENIDSYNNSIASLEADSAKIEELAKQQKELAESLQTQITQKEESIKKIEESIQSLEEDIAAKQAEIDAWDAQIKSRMQSEQTSIGTNMVIDLIMGSENLNDMLRRLSGVERITEDDQSQIEQLNELKSELELQKSEQERLQQETEDQKAQLEEQKTQVQELEESYNQLVEQYEQQIAELQAQKRSAQADMDSIRSFTISSTYSGGSIEQVDGFINPISGGSISAGTWAYPSGGLHLGLDWAASIGTTVVAPASGIIIYANNPAPSNGGYLGNWIGYPAGGGNTIEMLCNVGGTLYAVSFAHLSQNGFAVSAGQTVTQGQVLALTGNSGNSTGPHCHIEVYNLGSMTVEQAVARFSSNADFAWGTGWSSTGTACDYSGSTPCRERPEKFFG